jgi:hypothetical protein
MMKILASQLLCGLFYHYCSLFNPACANLLQDRFKRRMIFAWNISLLFQAEEDGLRAL